MVNLEQVATSNKSNEAPKNVVVEKTEVSNNVDYNLDKVDEQKFLEFKEMTDYIRKNGWEYGDEYNKIIDNVITPFEDQLKNILSKNYKDKINKSLDSMSDEEVANEADEIMKNQPEELKGQQELIKKINWNGSPEEIQKLNEIVNDSMGEVQSFYDKINKKAD